MQPFLLGQVGGAGERGKRFTQGQEAPTGPGALAKGAAAPKASDPPACTVPSIPAPASPLGFPQEDVPQLQGKSHGHEPQDQVHPADRHRPGG